MLNATSHRYVHADRSRDLVRQARVHPVAELHPRERRQLLSSLRGRLRLAPPAASRA